MNRFMHRGVEIKAPLLDTPQNHAFIQTWVSDFFSSMLEHVSSKKMCQ